MNSVNSTRVSAMARLNRLPISSYHRRLTGILGFVFFFDHADINTLAFASPAIMKQWHISISTIAALVSATFMGMFAGATMGGWLSDRIGRKKALIYTTIWYAGFSFLNGLAWEPVGLFVTRLLTGVGISAMTVVGIAYISEIFPARARGSYQGWIMVIGLCGVPATAYVARFFIPMGAWGWRVVFLWGSLGILFPFLSGWLEESPRWYENHGRFKEADEALDRIEARIVREVGVLPPVSYSPSVTSPRPGRFADLLSPSCLPRTFLLVIAWVFTTLGFFGFTSWVPTLLVVHGFSLVNSLAWSSAMSLAIIPGALIAALISDRWDRKWSIAVAAVVIAACGVIYGLTFQVATIIIFGLLVEMFIHTFMPLMYAYTAESFPSEIRNSGTGLAYGAGRLANVFGPLIVAFLYNHYGYTSVFLYIAMSWVLVALIIGGFGLRSRTLA
jgi:MFS transporter, putative metabolite:H+ symporter